MSSLFNEEKTSVNRLDQEVANSELKPNTSDMIATVDADTLVYAVASICEYGDDEAGYQLDLEYALKEAVYRVEDLKSITGCKEIELHFTTGKNFRFSLTDTYKANRVGQRTPAGLSELKKALGEEYTSKMHSEVEADDYVSWQKKFWPDKYIVCSPDKDVYNGNEGVHLNYYKSSRFKIPMKWISRTSEEALTWVYMQCLMGDATDGIAGIHRCGPKKAEKILKGKKTEFEMWNAVVKSYKDANMPEKEAILNMRLVSMHQLDKEGRLCLWTQPTE